ncbi:MAG: PorT family protein [Bacteroidales bacterium]|nr:PorT family protein [Bacteroidales bacterium]
MLRVPYFIILISISTQFLFAQHLNLPQKAGMYIMPYTLIDYTPRWRIGFLYYNGAHWSYNLGLGLGNHKLNKQRADDMSLSYDYLFSEIRPEIKYYFHPKKYFRYYVSGEVFAIFMFDTKTNAYYHKKNANLIVYYDRAEFYKQKYGLNIKNGIELIAWSFLRFDFYLGLGIAYRNISYKNVINPNEGEYYVFEEWWGHAYKYEGQKINPNLTLGLNIGIEFSQNKKE